jgi:two-component system response regulator GlrR
MIRIVAVDDDASVLAWLQTVLRAAGYTVVPVADSTQAASIIRAQRPACVLLDIRMQPVDGLAVLAALGPTPPAVVLMTAWLASEDIAALEASKRRPSVVAILTKPLDPARVLAAVEAAAPARPERPEG